MSAESTHHLYGSALYADVPKVVFFSSQAYQLYAHGPGVIDEDCLASLPANTYYDLSKVISEDTAQAEFLCLEYEPETVLRPSTRS